MENGTFFVDICGAAGEYTTHRLGGGKQIHTSQEGGRPGIGHTRESRSEQGNAPQGDEGYQGDYIIKCLV